MKILYITNLPSPYRVRYFNCLSTYCDLTVIYEKERSDERDKKWVENANEKYSTVFLRGISTGVDSAFSLGVISYLKKNYWDYIVICGISSLTEILAIQWCKLRNIPYCIEGDGAFSKDSLGFKEIFKKIMIKDAFLCFSTCKNHDEYYRTYGAKSDNIIRYPFSSVNQSDVLPEPTNIEQKRELRARFKMKEKIIVLSVGQFIYRKGFDILFKAVKNLSSSIGIYIVGGTPTKEYNELVDKYGLKNVTFVGFKDKGELAKYYQAADLFVLPTREDIWGLVINEAMANGLPVITTDRCNAGLELIRPGENGFIVKSEDVDDLKQRIEQFANSEMLLQHCAKGALKIIKNYTIEEMAHIHMKVFETEKKN